MPRITPEQAGSANRCAFLDMIASSEIGPALLAETDDGYNVLVGSTPGKPLTFASYAAPPDILNAALNSTAAGRYQVLNRYAVIYIAQLGLPDFGPVSQDLIALQQIRERCALPLIDAGNFEAAVSACSNIWASLPGNNYGQHVNALAQLQGYYVSAGGVLAPVQSATT
jgi:muramidase (phage lysozyme)